MDIHVNKDQIYRIVIKWLNAHYGSLTPKIHNHYPNKVFYVNSDNYIMMEYNKETDRVWIDKKSIWSKVESIFHISLREHRVIMRVWLEQTYKLEGIMPLEDISWEDQTM